MALQYYGGSGFESHYENGFYQIITKTSSLEFSKLSEAKEVYESINEEKAIWCSKTSTLIDCIYNTDDNHSDFF